jgi:lipid II:glycine glycyltransferase (peptidoglycan interpeptide bridge formation enzyme)
MRQDQEVHRLAVERDGGIAASICIQKLKLPYSPYSLFYAPRGPICDYKDVDALRQLMENVQKLAKEHHAVYLRVDPDAPDDSTVVRNTLCEVGFKFLKKKNWSHLNYPRVMVRLDLSRPESEILKSMHRSHRQRIVTLQKTDVTIDEARGPLAVNIFYGLMQDLSQRKPIGVRNKEYYERILSEYGSDARLLLARTRERHVAAVLCLAYGRECSYMYGATAGDKGNANPVQGMHWEMIKWAKQRGCSFYDFAGTGTDWPIREDNENYQMYLFKARFGSNPQFLTGYYDLIYQPIVYAALRLIEEQALSPALRAASLIRKLRTRGSEKKNAKPSVAEPNRALDNLAGREPST